MAISELVLRVAVARNAALSAKMRASVAGPGRRLRQRPPTTGAPHAEASRARRAPCANVPSVIRGNERGITMNRLENKVAVVTGANSGVGATVARLFAAEGATVVMTARREAALEEVAGEIEAAGGKTFVMATDISKAEDPERLMAAVEEKYGRIDVLVNNAGILESGLKPVDRFTDEDLDRIIETNQKGTMRCMRAASKRMSAGASIVNIASVAGEKGCGGAVYVSTKAAVIGVTKHTALRFQAEGIRCNAICPGTIVTPMVAGTTAADMDADMMGAMATHSNLRTQPCMPEDVANIALFLASDESRALTGQILVSDFGAML